VGVYSDALVEMLAEVLSRIGVRRALVVHGSDGLDEITLSGPTRIAEVRDSTIRTYEVTPEEFGIARAPLTALAGGDAAENAAIIRAVLAGEPGPRRDVVVLNTAAALVAAGRADHLKDAVHLAAEAIDSGAAQRKLDLLIAFTGNPAMN
jgi:anthranilate phosphoribosyltransferase